MDDDEFAEWINCLTSPDAKRNRSLLTDIPSASRTVILFNCTACFCLTVIAIFMNSIFLLSVKRDSSLRTASLKLLTALGVTDLIQGGISFPMFGAYLLNIANRNNSCSLQYFFALISHTFVLLEILSIFNIVLFQYLCISRPLHYVTNTPVFKMILSLPILGIINLIIASIQYKYKTIDSHLTFLSIVIIILLFFMIFFLARMPAIIKRSRMKVMVNNASSTLEQQRQIMRIRQTCFKSSKISFMMLITFIIIYLPAIIHNILLRRSDTYSSFHVKSSLRILGLSNCIVNCIVYQLMHARVRKAMQKFVRSANGNKKSSFLNEKDGFRKRDGLCNTRSFHFKMDVLEERTDHATQMSKENMVSINRKSS